MKLFLLSVAILISMAANAQVTSVSLQASGLTCSMCSNAINKALRSLDFIDKVEADIKHYTFEISFKPGAAVDFDKIKKKVEDAGFSVAAFEATIIFSNVQVDSHHAVSIDNISLRFLEAAPRVLNGAIKIRILNKGFLSSKEFKQVNLKMQAVPGTYYASL